MSMSIIVADTIDIDLENINKYALLALLAFSLAFNFVPSLLVADGLVLSPSLAIAAGIESAATFCSESALLFRRRLRLDSAGVSMA
jgi:hypothetical protein